MKLAWATDVHLDFCDAAVRRGFHEALSEGDAVLLTGDIANARRLEPLLVELATAVACPVYFVLGNHDFYGGRVREVRERVRALCLRDPRLVWLSDVAGVRLGESVLVGHDGWADGRFGDWEGSPVMLNDYVMIEELAGLSREERLARIQALAADSAAHLRAVLPAALDASSRVLVATHVPPFREACWHEGKISGDDWLPHFASRVVGEAIFEAVAPRGADVTVLCGHTHGAGSVQILPHLTVLTGGADYGRPTVARMLVA